MKARIKIFLILLSFVILAGISASIWVSSLPGGLVNKKAIVRIDGIYIRVSVADTPALRTQGLSGKDSLNRGDGMLFVFENPTVPGFWMKDMKFPIDIIWISPDLKVSYLSRDLSPDTYPEVFSPSSSVLYVLEVPAGFSDENKIAVGDDVSINR